MTLGLSLFALSELIKSMTRLMQQPFEEEKTNEFKTD